MQIQVGPAELPEPSLLVNTQYLSPLGASADRALSSVSMKPAMVWFPATLLKKCIQDISFAELVSSWTPELVKFAVPPFHVFIFFIVFGRTPQHNRSCMVRGIFFQDRIRALCSAERTVKHVSNTQTHQTHQRDPTHKTHQTKRNKISLFFWSSRVPIRGGTPL